MLVRNLLSWLALHTEREGQHPCHIQVGEDFPAVQPLTQLAHASCCNRSTNQTPILVHYAFDDGATNEELRWRGVGTPDAPVKCKISYPATKKDNNPSIFASVFLYPIHNRSAWYKVSITQDFQFCLYIATIYYRPTTHNDQPRAISMSKTNVTSEVVLRDARYNELPEIAHIMTKAFWEDNLFGDLIHPHRKTYPDDTYLYWLRRARVNFWDYRWKWLAAVSKDESGRETIAGIAQWARLGEGGRKLECSYLDPREYLFFYRFQLC